MGFAARGEYVLAWAPLAAWAGLIFALSSLPGGAVGDAASSVERATGLALLVDPRFVHAGEYAVLAILIHRVASARRWLRSPLAWLAVVAAAGAYGALDELHQAFVPGRETSLADAGFDILGAGVGLSMVIGLRLLRRLHRPR